MNKKPKTEQLNKNFHQKPCFGCGENFTRSRRNNYDYCLNCTINGNRHLPSKHTENKCPECGDGSGRIKFPNLPPRACKLCYLNQEAKVIQKEVNHA